MLKSITLLDCLHNTVCAVWFNQGDQYIQDASASNASTDDTTMDHVIVMICIPTSFLTLRYVRFDVLAHLNAWSRRLYDSYDELRAPDCITITIIECRIQLLNASCKHGWIQLRRSLCLFNVHDDRAQVSSCSVQFRSAQQVAYVRGGLPCDGGHRVVRSSPLLAYG